MTTFPANRDIASNLGHVQDLIDASIHRSGRTEGSVTLIAVTKTHGIDEIRAAAVAGVTHVGENRVQEAEEKIGQLQASGNLSWHLIGNLQKNKVAKALSLFDMIHSIDSLELARVLDDRNASRKPMPVLLEVNIMGEVTKRGFTPEETLASADIVAALPHLSLEGLMTIAPQSADPEACRPCFRKLAQLAEKAKRELPHISWRHLSMGMSQDFTVAIEEGATLVRIGSAIFGPRA